MIKEYNLPNGVDELNAYSVSQNKQAGGNK